VFAYARAASAALPPSDAGSFLDAVATALAQTPSGQRPGTTAIDGYDLVRLMSAEYGIDPAGLGAAYLQSRAQLASDLAPVVAPQGLADFLRFARAHANIVLATNAPDIRVTEALDALGLAGLFDTVYTSVGKPVGLDSVLDDWLPHGALLSIGDVWINDLAPAAARNALTALVGSSAGSATPTYRAEHLHELYPAIAAWLEADAAPTVLDTPSATAPTTTTKGSPRVL